VAQEAARLLYYGWAREYREAKEEAARSLGVQVLPSNAEVAWELDALAEELEGADRAGRLVEMRRAALRAMKALEGWGPVLIGSVWRGTIRRSSDIDIVVYSGDPGAVAQALGEAYPVVSSRVEEFKVGGRSLRSTHLVFKAGGFEGEVVVRPPEDLEAYRGERCEVYGDLKRGLKLGELEKLIETDPLRRFVPRRRGG